jgi:transposase
MRDLPIFDGILAHCRWPLGTKIIEGINNTIKVIKRMAYGFRDDHYFFLKIRAAFPEIREEPFSFPAGMDASTLAA